MNTFHHELLRRAVLLVAQGAGFEAATPEAASELADLALQFMLGLMDATKQTVEHAGRTHIALPDLLVVLNESTEWTLSDMVDEAAQQQQQQQQQQQSEEHMSDFARRDNVLQSMTQARLLEASNISSAQQQSQLQQPQTPQTQLILASKDADFFDARPEVLVNRIFLRPDVRPSVMIYGSKALAPARGLGLSDILGKPSAGSSRGAVSTGSGGGSSAASRRRAAAQKKEAAAAAMAVTGDDKPGTAASGMASSASAPVGIPDGSQTVLRSHYVPQHLPAFPSMHTFRQTPVILDKHISDLTIRIASMDESRQAADNLLKLDRHIKRIALEKNRSKTQSPVEVDSTATATTTTTTTAAATLDA
ncbi:hypothetical protein GQ42DRAFT_159035 [Ramicandelaber brevisporus]|nr:hypothetical protein GQ42DRAFT_159035 [Ramicandelaber brevisporus]